MIPLLTAAISTASKSTRLGCDKPIIHRDILLRIIPITVAPPGRYRSASENASDDSRNFQSP
jgi:hypothetical protein